MDASDDIRRSRSRVDADAEPVRVIVASGVRFYREGLTELLEQRPGIRVAGHASGWEPLLAVLEEFAPGVVLLDAALAPTGAPLRDVVDALGAAKVVVMAIPEKATDAVPWVEAGVAGYVASDASVDEVCAAIRAAEREEAICSPEVAAGLFRRVSRLSRMVDAERLPPKAAPERLTARERQVARLLARGWSNKRIARQLGIKLTTTKNHVHNVLQKLRLKRRGEVAAWHYDSRSQAPPQ